MSWVYLPDMAEAVQELERSATKLGLRAVKLTGGFGDSDLDDHAMWPLHEAAEAHGADFRLVAFMQYLRVVLVAAVASVVALWFTHGSGGRFGAGLFPPVELADLGATAAIALVNTNR